MEIRLKKLYTADQIEVQTSHQDHDPECCEKRLNQYSETNEPAFKAKSDENSRPADRFKNSVLPLSMKNRSLHWKTRATIGMAMNDTNYSQITRRLYSLLNGNEPPKEQKYSMLSNNKGSENTNTAEILGKDKIFLKEDNPKFESLSDINHDKLRGFLKQISVEKSGLSSVRNINIVNKSASKKHNIKDIMNKLKVKDIECESTKSDLSESILVQCKESKDNIVPQGEDLRTHDLKIGTHKKRKTSEKANKIKRKPELNSNMNFSNCVETGHPRSSLYKKFLNASSISTNRPYLPRSVENEDQIDKESESSSLEKVSTKVDSNYTNESESNLNSYLKMIGKLREKHHSDNFSRIQNQNFRICSNQKRYQDNQNLEEATNSTKENIPTSNHSQPYPNEKDSQKTNVKLPKKLDKTSSDSKPVLSNKGDCELKPKYSFSEKIIRIFTQSGQVSKKKKILQTSQEVVMRIAVDNLINLVIILSMELILNTFQSKNNHDKSLHKSEVAKKPVSESPSVNDKFQERSPDGGRKGSKNPNIVPSHSVCRNSDTSKKTELSFDYNGRAIRNPKVNSESSSQQYLHGSSVSLNNALIKNSLVHSIRSGSKVLKVLNTPQDFHQSVRRASGDHVKEPENGDSPKNMKRTRFKQTFQLTGETENRKPIGKQNNRRAFEISPYKSTSSIFRDHNGSSGKLTRNGFKSPRTQNRMFDYMLPMEVIENGSYRFSAQIKSRLDFLKVDEIFDLKEQLYNECNKSTIYIRRKSGPANSGTHHSANRGMTSWILHIESPTRTTLRSSLGIVATRFPEWNLQQFMT